MLKSDLSFEVWFLQSIAINQHYFAMKFAWKSGPPFNGYCTSVRINWVIWLDICCQIKLLHIIIFFFPKLEFNRNSWIHAFFVSIWNYELIFVCFEIISVRFWNFVRIWNLYKTFQSIAKYEWFVAPSKCYLKLRT